MSKKELETINNLVEKKKKIISVANGIEKADLVLKNSTYLNVFTQEFATGDIAISEGIIAGIGEYEGEIELDVVGKIITPGFIDAHIHLESSLVSPSEFARAVLPHGTTTVICDPHEISNVLGVDGIKYMLEATENLPIDVQFMLPSCVPATPHDESGAILNHADIDEFYGHYRVLGLAEMMNFVGVMEGDKDVLEKISGAQCHHKKIDGHAPELSGKSLCSYIAAGVYSDHECLTLENAMEKLKLGQFIMIREGTAAKNLAALYPLLAEKTNSRCMFSTDDKHPSDLLTGGHIDYCVKTAVDFGIDPILALKASSHNAARYFLMNNKGAIAPGYLADLVVLSDLAEFKVEKVFKGGVLRFDGKVLPFEEPIIDSELQEKAEHSFNLKKLTALDFELKSPSGLVGMVANEIVTKNLGLTDKIDVEEDILKIAVIERHKNTGNIGLGFIKGYGLKSGAIATSISHDSHNIIAVGASDDDIALAVNRVRELNGGIVVVSCGKVTAELGLPIAGLMSAESLQSVNRELENAKEQAISQGVNRDIDPFMTLSFASLSVIPELRVTTKGVFDVLSQKYI